VLPSIPSPAQLSFAQRAHDQLVATDPWVAAIWLTTSCILVLVLTAALIRTWSARRRWVIGDVDNCRVLIAEDEGQAVVGVIRPHVVLPRWAIDFDPAPRALLLHHEREHIRVGDPLALFAAASTVVLFPWNIALWWMVRRLRLAIEIDCDARVIHKFGGAHEYGRMLLAVGEHYARPLPLATTLVDAPSALQTRIDAITATPPARPLVASLPLLFGTLLALAAVANVPRPAPLAAMPALSAPWNLLSRQKEGTTVVLRGAPSPSQSTKSFDYEQQVGTSQVRSRLRADQVNAWSSVRVTGGEDPHAFGINVDIWKGADTLVGYMSEYGGFIADPPIAQLDSIRFNEQTGAISFSVSLTAGEVFSDSTTRFVRAKWLYQFAGVVGDSTITGSMRKTLLNRDSRTNVSSEQVVLKRVTPSAYEAETHNTLEKWVAWREMLVKLRGSGGEGA
jgi:hypothetical protein